MVRYYKGSVKYSLIFYTSFHLTPTKKPHSINSLSCKYAQVVTGAYRILHPNCKVLKIRCSDLLSNFFINSA